MSESCGKLTFDVATALVFNGLEDTSGFEMYLGLGQNGHLDGMVGTGVCLAEGLTVPQQEDEGIKWLRQAVERGSAQAQVELGNMYYMGTDFIREDERIAVTLFEAAAAQKHSHGMFMLADCLLEGSGCAPNPSRALSLLYDAAEKGHWGARNHLQKLLNGDWHFQALRGDFL
jgi:TPR repeat protein